jgi:hypothetical protein
MRQFHAEKVDNITVAFVRGPFRCSSLCLPHSVDVRVFGLPRGLDLIPIMDMPLEMVKGLRTVI